MYKPFFWVSLVLSAVTWLSAQSINSGTLAGVVTDPSGAVVRGATVTLRNPVAGYEQSVVTDDAGSFRLNNIPQNNYKLTAVAPGFAVATQSVDVRSSLPVTVNVSLKLAQAVTTVDVEATGAMVESEPSAHQDVDRSGFLKLPTFDPAGQLSQAITYSTGGVAADANGFFHPLGDHAQTTFVIDGQPISDQQSKVFSTQIPADAIESMELITGSPDAQYGDKSSLVVNATTRSALGVTKTFGSINSEWGSFGTWGGSASLGFGGPKYGNFIVANGIQTGHFLDTPELLPIHDIGNNESIFDRFDWQPTDRDVIHLNLFTARNWFQVPNSYDQLAQDQKQRVLTWNIAPGEMVPGTFSGSRLFTIGRLDLSSEGLILVTNDGELANRLTHPRYGVAKTYRVTVAGRPTREVLTKLQRGVHLAEGFARAERVEVKSHHKESTVLEMVLREGKNREIRRILARVGHKVLRLTRTAVGPVRLGTLPLGGVRRLTHEELKALRHEGKVAGGRSDKRSGCETASGY